MLFKTHTSCHEFRVAIHGEAMEWGGNTLSTLLLQLLACSVKFQAQFNIQP